MSTTVKARKVWLLGDSNFRNAFVKDKFEKELKAEVIYDQASSNESIKANLEDKSK